MKKPTVLLTTFMSASTLLFGGCLDTSNVADGKTKVDVELGSYEDQTALMRYLIPNAYAAISEVRMCFKRLRFKKDLGDDEKEEVKDHNIDLELGEVTLKPSGTSLGSVEIEQGEYRRIEFDLEDDCNGYSLYVDNNGVYKTDDRTKIRFRGKFVADDSEAKVTLGIKEIISAIEDVTHDDELSDAAEDASGTF